MEPIELERHEYTEPLGCSVSRKIRPAIRPDEIGV